MRHVHGFHKVGGGNFVTANAWADPFGGFAEKPAIRSVGMENWKLLNRAKLDFISRRVN